MMNTIHIEKYQSGQEEQIYRLIKKVYDEFVAVDYTEAGNLFFYDWIEPSRIAERQQHQVSLLVAWDGSEVIGMIEMRDNNTISLLFVDKEYQGLGIARQLLDHALAMCFQRDPEPSEIFVHASPFSIPVYQKLGFTATDVMQEEHGIKFLPMKMIFGE